MAMPPRSLNHIRTHSGRADQLSLPYRVYMQITCLEMEKARRDSERQSARRRMASLDARLKEIEKEKQKLLRSVNPGRRPETRPSPRPSTGGFRIRY